MHARRALPSLATVGSYVLSSACHNKYWSCWAQYQLFFNMSACMVGFWRIYQGCVSHHLNSLKVALKHIWQSSQVGVVLCLHHKLVWGLGKRACLVQGPIIKLVTSWLSLQGFSNSSLEMERKWWCVNPVWSTLMANWWVSPVLKWACQKHSLWTPRPQLHPSLLSAQLEVLLISWS